MPWGGEDVGIPQAGTSSRIYATDDKDQAYSYDGLHRLTNADEGTLSGETISGTPAQEEDYTLDALGNWSGYVTKTAGTAELDQSRTHNDVNEITDVTETTGPSWATPAHDAAGNMTTVPQPSDLTTSYTATYDAFNRLVKLEDGADTVAEYEYDGLNRRIVNSVYVSGALDHRQHVYYNEQWQVLEVRKETGGNEDADPLEQSIWHPYYVDALILRDYDEDVDGTSVRHYYAQDANFNVTAVTDDTGSVVERYHYTPYGQLQVLDADFSADADGKSDISNATTFTGRRYDSESGLYYYRNRMYHAELGRFVSRDPTFYEGSKWNLYEYVSSSPSDFIDPSGTEKIVCRYKCHRGMQAFWVEKRIVNCSGMGDKCCKRLEPLRVKGRPCRYMPGQWDIVGAGGGKPVAEPPPLCERVYFSQLKGADCFACCLDQLGGIIGVAGGVGAAGGVIGSRNPKGTVIPGQTSGTARITRFCVRRNLLSGKTAAKIGAVGRGACVAGLLVNCSLFTYCSKHCW